MMDDPTEEDRVFNIPLGPASVSGDGGGGFFNSKNLKLSLAGGKIGGRDPRAGCKYLASGLKPGRIHT